MTENIAETPAPYFAFRPKPSETNKTIVISGTPRGGTTFGASLVGHFGIPFSGEKDVVLVGRRWSHVELVTAATERDYAKFAQLCRYMDNERPVWALKFPLLFSDLVLASHLRNPHYVIVLKEPLSVAMRARMIRGKDLDDNGIAGSAINVLKTYLNAVEFCRESQAPVFLVSYDRAMRDPERTVLGLAEFLGIVDYNPALIASAVQRSHDKYFEASMLRILKQSSDWRIRTIAFLLSRLLPPPAKARARLEEAQRQREELARAILPLQSSVDR